MENPLHIPKNKEWKGVVVYCRKCNTNADYCRATGKKLQSCPFGDRHVFKVYVHVPGTKNERKTKNLKSRDIDEAIQEAIEFQKEVKQGYKMQAKANQYESKMEPANALHYPFADACSRYIGRLNNENIPTHRRQKEPSEEHKKDVERILKFCVQSFAKHGHADIGVGQLNDQMMGYLYDELLEQKFKPRTINKYLSLLTTFLSWHMEEFKVPERNWFATITREEEDPSDKLTITQGEFKGLIAESKKQGNGIEYYDHGSKLQRNYERPYMPHIFPFGLYSGMRRENLVTAKFSDIQEENGVPTILRVPNLKVNRILKLDNPKKMRYIDVPVTNELQEVLYSLEYEKYKGSDNYIIAPEINGNRTRVMTDLITRAFSHYYSKLNTGRKLTFKSLRKTYVTSLSLQYGVNAKLITGHSNDEVMDNHYRNIGVIAKDVAKNFSVFSPENDRKNELKKIRNNVKQNQLQEREK